MVHRKFVDILRLNASITNVIYAVCIIRRRRYSVKALLSILLGLMLLTSLVGISYATPTVQPTQSSGSNNNCLGPNTPQNDARNCHQDAGSHSDPPHNCVDSRISPDFCCESGITPHSFEVSDVHADSVTCDK